MEKMVHTTSDMASKREKRERAMTVNHRVPGSNPGCGATFPPADFEAQSQRSRKNIKNAISALERMLRASSPAERAEATSVARNHFSRNVLATLGEGWDAGTLNCVRCERAFQSFAGSAVCASCS